MKLVYKLSTNRNERCVWLIVPVVVMRFGNKSFAVESPVDVLEMVPHLEAKVFVFRATELSLCIAC